MDEMRSIREELYDLNPTAVQQWVRENMGIYGEVPSIDKFPSFGEPGMELPDPSKPPSEMTEKELSDAVYACSFWKGWALQEAGKCEALEAAVGQHLSALRSRRYVEFSSSGEKRTVALIEALVESDEEIQEFSANHRRLQQAARLFRRYADSYDALGISYAQERKYRNQIPGYDPAR